MAKKKPRLVINRAFCNIPLQICDTVKRRNTQIYTILDTTTQFYINFYIKTAKKIDQNDVFDM